MSPKSILENIFTTDNTKDNAAKMFCFHMLFHLCFVQKLAVADDTGKVVFWFELVEIFYDWLSSQLCVWLQLETAKMILPFGYWHCHGLLVGHLLGLKVVVDVVGVGEGVTIINDISQVKAGQQGQLSKVEIGWQSTGVYLTEVEI